MYARFQPNIAISLVRVSSSISTHACYNFSMWKVKLDDMWLAEGTATTKNEAEARLFPDMPSVQAQLKKVRRFMPYPNAMVVAEFPNYCP